MCSYFYFNIMEWLNLLFTNSTSVAHIVFLYALVIAIGVELGKIKIGGISLGVTFVLFVGIIAGHLYKVFGPAGVEYACPEATLNFIQDFGLILFVYCIGLQVGPGFFESFKKGGITMNMLTVGLVFLNVLVMLVLYFVFFDTSNPNNLPMMVGVLCGAVTNTPGLGAANETLSELFPGQDLPQIASGYACAYPLGVVGIIGATIAIRALCNVKLKAEEEQIRKEQAENPHAKPYHMSLRISNPSLFGKTFLKVRDFLGREFVCTHHMHNGEISIPNKDTILQEGDELNIVCAEDDADAITVFIGEKVDVDWKAHKDEPIVSKRILVTRANVNGKTFGQMHFSSMYGVNVTRITRSGMDLFADRSLRIQIGDRLMVIGPEDAVQRVENILGNSIKRLDHPNVGAIFIGIFLGIIIGSIPFTFPGIPNPVKLGLAGGPLVIAILIGRFGYKAHLVTYTTTSANLLVREIGLILFLASVGIKAGANFWNTVVAGDGLMYVWTGFLITVIPILIIGVIAKLRCKLNYFTLMGLIAGSCTDPPALGFANQTANNDAPAVGYSTVYPLAMFLRILTAQIIILIFCAT